MAKAPGIFNSKALTEQLTKLGREAVSIDNEGNPITRDDLLAALLWKQALGWEEEVRDDEGNRRIVKHPPVGWCQQFLYERREGKAAPAAAEQINGVRAADRVRDLARQRLNKLAAVASGPPKFSPKKEDGDGVEGNS